MPETGSSLMTAVDELGHALRVHAEAALDRADVPGIIQASNALREAALVYERRLMEDTGWSNPIRHLGKLQMYSAEDRYPIDETAEEAGDRFRVVAVYTVEAVDAEMLANLAEGRGAERPADAQEAIRFLFESDSWDVWQYPPGRVRLVDVEVDIAPVEDA